MSLSSRLAGLLAISSAVQAYIPSLRNSHDAAVSISLGQEHSRRANDPADFSWVKRWAAIGDSYTAGIGSGVATGNMLYEELSITLPNGLISGHGDWYCARYDMSYPMIMDRLLGGQVEDFQYLACSGDRSQQIYQQAKQLKGSLDLVVMTAGGNDLCLAGIISSCILLSSRAHDECETVISKAEANAKNIIKGNIKDILYALNDKMNKDGVVVVNGYAEFFNTDNEDCANQSWDFFWWLKPIRSVEKLTLERRKRFNKLVTSINGAIAEAVNEAAADDSKIKYKVGFADWNKWVYEGVDGQMCSTKSNGDYPDPNQPDMQFIKPDTHPWFNWADDIRTELRRRGPSKNERRVLENMRAQYENKFKLDERIYDSPLYKSVNPPAIARSILSRRDPQAPGCPGDDSWDKTRGLGLPNKIGANFHPNENGHLTIASFALAEAMDLRSLVLGVGSPSCERKDQFKCWSGDKSKAYAMADRLDAHYEDFCNSVKQPDHTTGWHFDKSYDEGTPDEHWFHIGLSDSAGDFDKGECIESMKALIHNCDTNSKMNWKFGGQYVRGEHTYEVNIKRHNRPYPPPNEAVGRCEGWYKVFFGSYEIEGGGFSTWDYGQKTMIPNMNGCYGLGTTKWKFDYYDEPTKDGYEWKATFHTPIWVRARCFNNNKVVKGAGGWTNGCKGND
ncbi:hypothetical protein QQS21_007640 [Conoideocrella luteorostrata]|uniref:SGNH hydrolase-type esterase domain-containing protein n=1 Tax=Conoideocrella luteorostrata TaxID=1105319 RepID=A0AAJ0CN38_9HYPO|nr:hypothetical protein QQS21_007640 [Conoideocrella luteorostrata]